MKATPFELAAAAATAKARAAAGELLEEGETPLRGGLWLLLMLSLLLFLQEGQIEEEFYKYILGSCQCLLNVENQLKSRQCSSMILKISYLPDGQVDGSSTVVFLLDQVDGGSRRSRGEHHRRR